MSRKRYDRRAIRREEAEDRQRHYDNMTPAQRLEQVEGRGHGHCAEAKRLREQVADY